MAEIDEQDMGITEEAEKKESVKKGFSWALAFTVITCLSIVSALVIYLDLSKKVEAGGEEVSKFLKSFVDVTEVSREWSHFGALKSTQNLQVAILKSGETFVLERTEKYWKAEGKASLKVDVPVRYYYFLDLKKDWKFHWDEETNGLIVIAPKIEFNEPAIDYHQAEHRILESSVLVDEEAMLVSLKKSLPVKVSERAKEHIALAKDSVRREAKNFVEDFFLPRLKENYPGKVFVREVIFSDEDAVKVNFKSDKRQD